MNMYKNVLQYPCFVGLASCLVVLKVYLDLMSKL